jgi:hypothetical protein
LCLKFNRRTLEFEVADVGATIGDIGSIVGEFAVSDRTNASGMAADIATSVQGETR